MSGNVLFLGNKKFEIPPFFQTRPGDLGKKVHACSLRFSALKFEPHSERASQAIEKHKSRLQTSKEAGILETVAHFYWQILVCDYTC